MSSHIINHQHQIQSAVWTLDLSEENWFRYLEKLFMYWLYCGGLMSNTKEHLMKRSCLVLVSRLEVLVRGWLVGWPWNNCKLNQIICVSRVLRLGLWLPLCKIGDMNSCCCKIVPFWPLASGLPGATYYYWCRRNQTALTTFVLTPASLYCVNAFVLLAKSGNFAKCSAARDMFTPKISGNGKLADFCGGIAKLADTGAHTGRWLNVRLLRRTMQVVTSTPMPMWWRKEGRERIILIFIYAATLFDNDGKKEERG